MQFHLGERTPAKLLRWGNSRPREESQRAKKGREIACKSERLSKWLRAKQRCGMEVWPGASSRMALMMLPPEPGTKTHAC